ncbi:MAG: preprotein translocase subunit SecA [Candidatus Yanofskybacteria bacterium]|nr:preprotein translocase subunit SecA [Candidatus Yanofskybacteria bacterium]
MLKTFFAKRDNGNPKKYEREVAQINAREQEYAVLSLEQLKEKTKELHELVAQGKTLDELLPQAFALVRESGKRTLHQRHFDVQLIGGIVMHKGKIAEMKTGEGKTLTATLPAYLNALRGTGVHVVTVNDYLAKRDAVWMGQIYYALGLSVSCITHEGAFLYDPSWQGEKEQGGKEDTERDIKGNFLVEDSYLRPCTRREAYAADITYGTNNEFGFDYLRDNMAYSLESQAQRQHAYAIVDEIDSVLIDEARTPLIISAPDEESSKQYSEFARLVPRLERGRDFEVDEKLRAVTLTEQGIDAVERILGVQDIYQEKGIKFLHHLEQALRSQALFEKDKDYVVQSGQIVIVDEYTGRLLPGRRYSGGLHQALEAKEGVVIQPESITLASITFQNYFRMYEKLAGMTGTAKTSEEEFFKVYGLEVEIIPTNKPMIRKDYPDRVYKTEEGKFRAVAQEIKERHKAGQPVLVGTVSIQKNEYIAKLLDVEGVPHAILNAKNHEREAAIIAQAGRLGAVTVATNMAGRGVDIILGGNPPDEQEAGKVKEVGGLHVIGTERHEARRIDNQLRGRSGRQGDPGSSQFYVSLQDDVTRIFGGERIAKLMGTLRMPEDQPIESGMISRSIESAQGKVEGFHFDARKHVLEYDTVLNKHREVVYKKRREFLKMAERDAKGEQNIKKYILSIVDQYEHTREEYEQKEKEMGERMREAEKIVVLRSLDTLWVEHLENMEALRDSVKLRAYGQQDPLVEYKNEGHRMFQDFTRNLDSMIVNSILRVQVAPAAHTHPHASTTSSSASFYAKTSSPPKAPQSGPKVGRNDPCPCGSGKKYKKCHGK